MLQSYNPSWGVFAVFGFKSLSDSPASFKKKGKRNFPHDKVTLVLKIIRVIDRIMKKKKKCHIFNPGTQEAETGRSQSLRSA